MLVDFPHIPRDSRHGYLRCWRQFRTSCLLIFSAIRRGSRNSGSEKICIGASLHAYLLPVDLQVTRQVGAGSAM